MNAFIIAGSVASVLTFCKVVYPLVRVCLSFTIFKWLFTKRKCLRTSGDWAIITGGGDGIGGAFARQLARDGLNIFILGRTKPKLESTAAQLELEYGVQTKILTVDFTKPDIYQSISEELDKLSSIACLVNNVGMVNQHFEEFASEPTLTVERIQQMLNCNITSTVCMTRLVLPRLLKQNTKAALINISSAAGGLCLPYHLMYSSTKAFVTHFGECLEAEVNLSPLIVQNYCPMYIVTNLTSEKKGFFTPDPDTFAKSALDMLGVERNTTGYFRHNLQTYAYTFAPSKQMTASIREDFNRRNKKAI